MSSNEPRDQLAAAPEHPVGWYRTMESAWATEHFGFPANPTTGDEWTASDGSVWVYQLTGTRWWEMSMYPPGPDPTPGDELATMLARKLAEAWEFERHETIRPYRLMPVAGRLMHDTDLMDALAGFIGWRPPARVIETAEELDTLPVGSIVMEIDQKDWQSDPCPIVWMRVDIEDAGLRWAGMGDGGDWPTAELDVPAMLLWEPVIA